MDGPTSKLFATPLALVPWLWAAKLWYQTKYICKCITFFDHRYSCCISDSSSSTLPWQGIRHQSVNQWYGKSLVSLLGGSAISNGLLDCSVEDVAVNSVIYTRPWVVLVLKIVNSVIYACTRWWEHSRNFKCQGLHPIHVSMYTTFWNSHWRMARCSSYMHQCRCFTFTASHCDKKAPPPPHVCAIWLFLNSFFRTWCFGTSESRCLSCSWELAYICC